MRIVIETDEAKPALVTTASSSLATAPAEVYDGGAGSSADGSPASDTETGARDCGPPPQWLVDAIEKDMSGAGGLMTGVRDESDGGRAPE